MPENNNNNDITEQIRREQVAQLFAGLPVSLFAILVVSAGLVGILWPVLGKDLLLAWWFSVAVVCVGRLGFFLYYKRHHEIPGKSLDYWETGFLYGVILSGVLWGVAAIVLFTDDIVYQAIIGFILGGVSAGAMSTLSFRALAARYYLFLILLPLVFQLALSADASLNIMALIVVMFMVLLTGSSNRLYKNYEQQIRLSLQSAAREKLLQKSIASLQAQYEISIDSEMSFEDKVNNLLRLGLKTFELDTAVISQISDATYTVKYAAGITDIVEPGSSFDLANVYCSKTYTLSYPCGFHHAADSSMACHPCYKGTGIETYLGMVIFKGNERYGTLGFFSAKPRETPFSEQEFALIQSFAQWLGNEMLRTEAEEKLGQFKTTLDLTKDCVFMFDPSSLLFIYVNQGGMSQVGCSYEELMTMTPMGIMPDIDVAAFESLIAPLLAKEQSFIVFETDHQHKNGERIPVEVFLQYIEPPGERPRFIAIVHDITERKRIDRMKDEFISTVSHELRTPLTSIRGSLGLLLAGTLGEIPAGQEKILSIASGNTERLLHLINDMLDLQKISSGKSKYEFMPLGVKALLESAVAVNEGYAREYKVGFKLSDDLVDVFVNGDYGRLMQVMANLLSNAAKFSPQGADVLVACELKDGSVRITVSDSGPGVPEAFQKHLFQKFSQLDSSDTRKPGGTGLGLSISRLIVEHHGGHIGFEPAKGQGACFYFDLPVIEPPPV